MVTSNNNVENLNWQEADQLAIYKCGPVGVFGYTLQKSPASGQSGT